MPKYFIQRRGETREEGPFCEEELLDLLDEGEISPADWCRPSHAPRPCRVDQLFQTITPEVRPSTPQPHGRWLEEGEEAPEEDEAIDAEDDFGLPEEEQLVYHGSPSVFSYTSQVALIGLVLAAGWWAGAFGLWWVAGSVGLAVLLLARVLLHRAAREYTITTERVESSIGLVRRVTRSLRLRDMTAIRLHQSGVLGWLGIGTVIFAQGNAEEDEVVFERVARVRRVIARVREWQKRQPRV